jgi:hypothetical protein
VGRRQVDGEALHRELELRVEQRRSDPFPRLPDRAVREPDEREGGQASPNIDLDGDLDAANAFEGEGEHAGEHAQGR